MTTFATITILLSLSTLAGFIVWSARKFGLLASYSSYAAKWAEAVPIHGANLWSLVTAFVALLAVPALIERGAGNPLQFLGFMVPAYLIFVASTPDYESNRKQRIGHMVCAIACAVCMVAYSIALHLVIVPILAVFVCGMAAFATLSERKSAVLWGEIAMFMTAYAVTLIGG
jgi:hypothetical protein